MTAIWKYTVSINGATVRMPAGARLLHVADQNGDPMTVEVWAEVDPDVDVVDRVFVVVGTGHPYDTEVQGRTLTYVGTAVTARGHLVWHLFDAGEL